MRRAAIVIAINLAAQIALGQTADADVGFFTGQWRGVEGNTIIEEQWSRSEDGQMIGMFRMMRDGAPVFYELMTIEHDEDGLVMYLRHFSPRLQAWEDKTGALVFDLVSIEETRAVFDQRGADTNLVYELDGPDRLVVTLEKMTSDGEWDRTPFVYSRD